MKPVDFLEVRRGRVQSFSIDDQMPIIADAHVFSSQCNEPFDVELILSQSWNAFGLEYNNFSARRLAKVVAQSIDKQMIPVHDS